MFPRYYMHSTNHRPHTGVLSVTKGRRLIVTIFLTSFVHEHFFKICKKFWRNCFRNSRKSSRTCRTIFVANSNVKITMWKTDNNDTNIHPAYHKDKIYIKRISKKYKFVNSFLIVIVKVSEVVKLKLRKIFWVELLT